MKGINTFIPRGKKQCQHVETFDDRAISEKSIDANQIIFSQMIPLPREGKQLDMSRWFQNLVAVIDVSLEFNADNPYPEDKTPEMLLVANLFYRDKEDDEDDWKLLASSNEHRMLDCNIESNKRAEGHIYNCELLPLFELGSVHYDYYLINIRLPVQVMSDINIFGKLDELSIIVIFQNGGFTKVWFSMKTVLFPTVIAVLIWFWRRVLTQGRSTNLTERTLLALGVILSIMNCPIEWLTLAINMPFLMLLNDIRDGAFYAMLLSFWIIFVGEHMMDQLERNRLFVYWKHLTVVLLACLALFIFDICERGRQLVNPFYSIWSSPVGAATAFGFIIVAAIAACLYFVFLCYLVFRVLRNIRSKRTSLLHMSTLRRKYYLGLIFRFKFLMFVTLLCAALTVISFIIGQVSEGHWKWGEEDVGLEYTSAFLTGVYGMWNVYVVALLSLYAPSHKKFTSDIDDTDSNSHEEEVQLTQLPSETSNLASFITKSTTD
uniref:Protein wntless n=1 Tax=Arion vulgaris TaxID=1028688 RepID=A0A0B7A378_9EUPU